MEDGFVPRLVAAGIDQRDIHEVCVERALMGNEDEDEEEEMDLKPPVVKPGRNEPCWCGSGKKYKKCHLVSDQERTRQDGGQVVMEGDEGTVSDADIFPARLRKELIKVAEERIRSDFVEAAQLYFDRHPSDMAQEDIIESGFWEWYIHEFRSRPTGRTAVEELLHRRGPKLSERERDQIEAWRRSRFGLYQVEGVEENIGVELKDLCAGGTFFVYDVSSSKSMVRWDCLMSRVEEFEGRRVFLANGLLVSREILPGVLRFIETERKKSGQSAAEFVAANSHRFYRVLKAMILRQTAGRQFVNAEDDPLELCSATYEVSDESTVLKALQSMEEFEDTTDEDAPAGVHQFGWLETGVTGPRRAYGHIEMKDGRLRLECNSRRRLNRGRELIEGPTSGYLRHLGDAIESAEALKRRVTGGEPRDEEEALPADFQREAILKLKEDHYRTWPDKPLPALGGKKPRDAVKTVLGKQAVLELLRTMENGELRQAKAGHPAYDFSKLRNALGLTED